MKFFLVLTVACLACSAFAAPTEADNKAAPEANNELDDDSISLSRLLCTVIFGISEKCNVSASALKENASGEPSAITLTITIDDDSNDDGDKEDKKEDEASDPAKKDDKESSEADEAADAEDPDELTVRQSLQKVEAEEAQKTLTADAPKEAQKTLTADAPKEAKKSPNTNALATVELIETGKPDRGTSTKPAEKPQTDVNVKAQSSGSNAPAQSVNGNSQACEKQGKH